MNIASFLLLLLVGVAVWYAIRVLRRDKGHSCSGCRGGEQCRYCRH